MRTLTMTTGSFFDHAVAVARARATERRRHAARRRTLLALLQMDAAQLAELGIDRRDLTQAAVGSGRGAFTFRS